MFFIFIAFLIAGAILPIAVFSTGEIVGLSAFALPSRAGTHPVRHALGYGRTLVQGYVWFGWAAYCAWLAIAYGAHPEVVNPFLYYATALAATSVPVAYLHLRDRWTATSDEECAALQRATNLWRIALLFSCMSFLVLPELMNTPYGWLTRTKQPAVSRVGHRNAGVRPFLTREPSVPQVVMPASAGCEPGGANSGETSPATVDGANGPCATGLVTE